MIFSAYPCKRPLCYLYRTKAFRPAPTFAIYPLLTIYLFFPFFTTNTHRFVMFPLFTVILTIPAFFALITPFPDTTAIFLFDDLYEILSVLPALTFTFNR